MKDTKFYNWAKHINNQELIFDLVLVTAPMLIVGPGKGLVAFVSIVIYLISLGLSFFFWFDRGNVMANQEAKKLSEITPDIYANELNTQRITAYKKLAEEYNVSESIIRDVFCKGADWYKSIIENTVN